VANFPVKRPKRVEIWLTEEEYETFNQWADAEGLTLAEYIRVAVIADACLSGHKQAWKMTFYNASRKARNLFVKRLPWVAKVAKME
jgi:hypothetical protein